MLNSSGALLSFLTFSGLILGSPSWIRVQDRLVRTRDYIDMESQLVTVDQFTSMISSIQEAIARVGQRGGQ